MALATKSLQQGIGLEGNKARSTAEKKFTKQVATFLTQWSKGATSFAKKMIAEEQLLPGGLVIGLTASRVISNVLSHHWNQLLKKKITPIHYGRYIDDMFLVLRDPGSIININVLAV